MSNEPQPTAPTTPRQLSTFVKLSIVLLAGLSIAAISLLFIGDFEGRGERVFATFFAFAIFVLLTAFDTRRQARGDWYSPVALIANSYILGLLLIIIWLTPASWALTFSIFTNTVIVVFVTRAVVFLAQLLAKMSAGRPKALRVFSLTTSLLATLTGILFTAPLAIELFNVRILELYWRIAVASLMLTALALSIALLLRWAYGKDPAGSQAAAAPVAPTGAAVVTPVTGSVATTSETGSVAKTSETGSASTAAKQQELLPWPTFEDGSPLPIGPDGQPDFSALPSRKS